MTDIYQIEPSYDDLAFEPKMTWEELCKKWKKYYNKDSKSIVLKPMCDEIEFDEDGTMNVYSSSYDSGREEWYGISEDIKTGLSCEEMDTIITILDKEK